MMNTENNSPQGQPQQPVNIEELIFKASVKQVKTLVIATAVIVATFCAGYYDMKGKENIQDLQLETLKLQVEQIKVDLHDHQQQINNKKDK